MSENCWEWIVGIVDTNERYFELKYGFEPAPVVRIGITNNKNLLLNFCSPLSSLTDSVKKYLKK